MKLKFNIFSSLGLLLLIAGIIGIFIGKSDHELSTIRLGIFLGGAGFCTICFTQAARMLLKN